MASTDADFVLTGVKSISLNSTGRQSRDNEDDIPRMYFIVEVELQAVGRGLGPTVTLASSIAFDQSQPWSQIERLAADRLVEVVAVLGKLTADQVVAAFADAAQPPPPLPPIHLDE